MNLDSSTLYLVTFLIGLLMGYVVWQARSRYRSVRNKTYNIVDIGEREATLLNSIHEAVILTDLDRRITAWNHGAEVLFGYTAEEAFGKQATNFLTPDMTTQTRRLILESLQQTGSWFGEEMGRNKAGEPLNIELKIGCVHDLKGDLVGYLGVHNDVTEHKKALVALQENETMLRQHVEERTLELQRERGQLQTILDSMGEGVIYSEGRQIRYVNLALAALTGYRTEDLIGVPD